MSAPSANLIPLPSLLLASALIRNTHASPSRQKEAVLSKDIIAMLATLDRGTLRGLRDRTMLLIGFAISANIAKSMKNT